MPLAQDSCTQKELHIYITCAVEHQIYAFKSSLNIYPEHQLLPCTPVQIPYTCSLPTPQFTVPPIGGAFGIQSNICGGAFCRNSQRVLQKSSTVVFNTMFDRILNATLTNNLL